MDDGAELLTLLPYQLFYELGSINQRCVSWRGQQRTFRCLPKRSAEHSGHMASTPISAWASSNGHILRPIYTEELPGVVAHDSLFGATITW